MICRLNKYFLILSTLLLLFVYYGESTSLQIQFYLLTLNQWKDLNLAEKLQSSVASACQSFCASQFSNCGLIASDDKTFTPSQVILDSNSAVAHKSAYLNVTLSVKNSKADLLTASVLQEIAVKSRTTIQSEFGYSIILINSNRYSPPPPFTANVVISVLMTIITLVLIAASCGVHKMSDKQIVEQYLHQFRRASSVVSNRNFSQTNMKEIQQTSINGVATGNYPNNSNKNRVQNDGSSSSDLQPKPENKPLTKKQEDGQNNKSSTVNGSAVPNSGNNGKVAGKNEAPELQRKLSNPQILNLTPTPPFDSVAITETESTTPSSTYKHPPPKPLQRPAKTGPISSSPPPEEEENMVVEDLKMNLIDNDNIDDKQGHINTETSGV